MKTNCISIAVLSFFFLLSFNLQAQPMSINGRNDNNTSDAKMPMSINGPKSNAKMPMSINSPKSNALHGFFQVGNQAAQFSLQTGSNTLQIPGVQAKFNAVITEDFQLWKLEDMLRDDLIPVTPVTTPDAYTDPGSAHFYALAIPTADGKVVKGILAIGIGETSPFISLPDPLPYWW